MSYLDCRVLDLSEKLLDQIIKEAILGFEDLTAEEKIILLEEYCEKYQQFISLEDVRRG